MSFQENTRVVVDALAANKIVPVLILNSVDDGLKMCETLVENGLPVAEVTFRTEAASQIIKEAGKRFPELFLGAGTVLNVDNLHRAIDSGAKFAVAPGLNPKVVTEAMKEDFPFAPGICTPSEIEQALDLGCTFIKFFPAEPAGGVKYIQSIVAPYKHLGIRVMPTGGITPAIVPDYLAVKEIIAIGGSWLGKAADITAGNWEKIAQGVRDAVKLAQNA